MGIDSTEHSTHWGRPISSLASLSIEYLIPRTATIAAISFAAGWYSYRYILTHAPGVQKESSGYLFQSLFGDYIGGWANHFVTPFWVPDTTKYFAKEISIGISLTTSLICNLFSRIFFGIGTTPNQEKKEAIPGLKSRKKVHAFSERIQYSPPKKNSLQSERFKKNRSYLSSDAVMSKKIFGKTSRISFCDCCQDE